MMCLQLINFSSFIVRSKKKFSCWVSQVKWHKKLFSMVPMYKKNTITCWCAIIIISSSAEKLMNANHSTDIFVAHPYIQLLIYSFYYYSRLKALFVSSIFSYKNTHFIPTNDKWHSFDIDLECVKCRWKKSEREIEEEHWEVQWQVFSPYTAVWIK